VKQISKIITHAKQYETWINSFGASIQEKYSSSNLFHKDVLYQLLICQEGLCAYTEYRIVSQQKLEKIKNEFVLGKYNNGKRDLPIDIEHFDSRLKIHFGWKWDNLFAVFSLINQKTKRREEQKLNKKGKSVHTIMKPDNTDYNPHDLLMYEPISNMFIPNIYLNKKDQEQVKEMILCLGLNNGFIKTKRIEYFNELIVRDQLGETLIPHQFMTGWDLRKT
jgi:hypothetical protein